MVELNLTYNAEKMELTIYPIESSRLHNIAEVVRCKDCEYYKEQDMRCDHPSQFCEYCYDCWLEMQPDDYCSYGERRTDGEQA